MPKSFNIKIYTIAGDFVMVVPPSKIMSNISFSSVINEWQGQLSVKLNYPFSQTIISMGNIIKVFAVTESYQLGKQIYVWSIDDINRVLEKNGEYIEIRAIGIGSLLGRGYYKNWSSKVFTKNQEPATTIKDIIDLFLLKYPWAIYYDWTSIENYWSSLSFDFSNDFNNLAIKKIVSTIPFFWSVDWDWKINFHPKNWWIGVLTHNVTVWKDIDGLVASENSENVKNSYTLNYTGGTVSGSDSASITQYGEREYEETKAEISNVGTANIAVATYILENKDYKKRTSCTVNSQYNIESIRPWDLLTVRNLDYSILTLQINRIEYDTNTARLEMEKITSLWAEIFA